ncbi:DinB family protein [Modestobacter sp. VKM Ac-2977]|uniref:DinB family protein n=1 Tax=Modestobacter sp. VKM Ac-2977 TaxID=3004131 RepID=UPI0022AA594B|nr:DinB family protein [Modestobacter sp. VKM Ac-2977]MCZ2820172.1 DinB family protein [Modestobacter sp. VKM Ac-2977]
MTDRLVLPVLLRGWDEARGRLDQRLTGLDDAEYLDEPVDGAWSVRRGDDGGWTADWVHPAPDPAPVTTIAWRLWHLASDCFADYLARTPSGRPLAVTGREWQGDAASALRDLDTAATAFRTAMTGLGEEGMWRPLGPDWGPYADAGWADLLVHATDELAHHGAEIALLRDLYRWR